MPAPESPSPQPSAAKVRRRWELVVADDLTPDLAGRIGQFLQGFAEPGNPHGRRSRGADYLLWKIARNQHGRGFVSLAMDGDRIVGTTSVTPKRIWFGGEWIRGAEIGDTFTDAEYQRQGIFSSLVESTRDRAVASGIRLIYGTPNLLSLYAYEKNCRFSRKNGLNLLLCLWPLKPGSVAAAKFEGLRSSRLVGILDRIGSRALNLDTWRWPSHCTDGPCRFEEEFDALDAQLRRKHEFMLGRSASDLTYRLVDNPERDRYGMIRIHDSDGSLSGALIHKETHDRGLRILFVGDSFARGHLENLRLWRAARAKGRASGCHLLATWLPGAAIAFFSRFPAPPLPVARKELILYDHDRGAEALRSDGSWRFSILDSDNL